MIPNGNKYFEVKNQRSRRKLLPSTRSPTERLLHDTWLFAVSYNLPTMRNNAFHFALKQYVNRHTLTTSSLVVMHYRWSLETKNQLTGISQAGGFERSKWASNNSNLWPDTDYVEKHFKFDFITILGLIWNPNFTLKSICNRTYLIMQESHSETFHWGPQLSVSHAIRRFWITHIQVLPK